MRQRSSHPRIPPGNPPIHAPIDRQQRGHRSRRLQIPPRDEDSRDDAECQIAPAHALHEARGEGVVLGGHAEQSGHCCGREEGEEAGAEEEGGYAVVGEEFEGGLICHRDAGNGLGRGWILRRR